MKRGGDPLRPPRSVTAGLASSPVPPLLSLNAFRIGTSAFWSGTIRPGLYDALAGIADNDGTDHNVLLPTVDQYAAAVRDHFAPLYNSWHVDRRMCFRCGTVFALVDARAEKAKFCSERCASAERQAAYLASSPAPATAKAADKKLIKRLQAHTKKCRRCAAGQHCPTYEGMMTPSDALTSRRSNASPEAAEAISRQDGNRRTPTVRDRRR
jgi:hypothetical protein